MDDDFDLPHGELMRGKRGIVMGVANKNSIAWGIASQIAAQGGEVALAYMESNEKRVRPLGEKIGVQFYTNFDASSDDSMEASFKRVEDAWGGIDFLVTRHRLCAPPTRSRARSSRTPPAPASPRRWTSPVTASSTPRAGRRG